MKHFRLCGLILTLGLAPWLRADLTLRYTTRLRLGSSVPEAEAKEAKGEMDATMLDTTSQMKGDRVHVSIGHLECIKDYAKGTITVLDRKSKRVATIPLAEYMADIATGAETQATPKAPDVDAGLKIHVKSEKTARTAVVHGILTEESVL